MTFIKLLVILVLCFPSLFLSGESNEIIELPKEVPTVETGSALPQNVQISGTNSSSPPVEDNAVNLSSTAAPQTTLANSSNSSDTNTTVAGTVEQVTTRLNTTPNSISIGNFSAFENATFEVNLTSTPSFEDAFQNDTLEFENSSTTEPTTDPPSSGRDSQDQEDDLSVRQTMFLDDYCNCDIKVDSCDIGCCCDQDCSTEDKRAFAACLNVPRPLAGDSRYCMQKWVVQRHNTEFMVDTTNPNLFCITTDNLVKRTSFPPLKVIRTAEDFQKLSHTLRRGIPSSSAGKASLLGPTTMPFNKPYKHADWVWGVSREGSLFPIGLPSPMFTSNCETESKLKYLIDFTTECQRQVHLNLKQSKDKALHPSYYTNFHVLMQPTLLFEQEEEEDTTTTTTTEPTQSTSTASSSSSTTTPTDGSSHSSSTTSDSLNNSFGTDGLLNVFSNSTAAPGVDSTTHHTSTSVDNTDEVTVNIELTPSTSTSTENQALRNKSADSLNLEAQLKSFDNVILLQDEPSIFNDTLLCEVRVILCFTSNETVCYNASDHKSLLTQCDVVTEVNYLFFHNGSEGIKSVTAKVTVKDVCSKTLTSQRSLNSFDEDLKVELSLKQKFTVEYRWAQNEEKLVRERSGRPGYWRGKPLLFGRVMHNVSEEGFPVQAISMDSDPMLGLTVMKGASTGDCTARAPVVFGENLQTQCRMQLTSADIVHNCSQLRERVRSRLLGNVLSDRESDFKIGMYGDSDVLQTSQWVSLLRTRDTSRAEFSDDMLEESRCLDLMLSITVEVAFALQGSIANPQAKVVGALLTEGPLRPSPPAYCVGPFCPARPHFDGGSTSVEDDQKEANEGSGYSQAINERVGLTDQEGSGPESFLKNTSEPPAQKLTRRHSSTETEEELKSQTAESINTQSFASHAIEIELSTTVIFIDVTEPSEPVFPEAPRLDIKLPENFFYPLVPSSSSSRLKIYKFFPTFCLSAVLFLLL
ncbi:protein of unknown function DUF1619 [Trinorchestia longiramus]|nr:protein of unknown function DUF1619 [Trinorchestia longiramus]